MNRLWMGGVVKGSNGPITPFRISQGLSIEKSNVRNASFGAPAAFEEGGMAEGGIAHYAIGVMRGT